MRKCSYCGYISKENYVNCPKCGATQYEKIDNIHGYEVKEYKANKSLLNFSLSETQKEKGKALFKIVLFSSIFLAIALLPVIIAIPKNPTKEEILQYIGHGLLNMLFSLINPIALFVLICLGINIAKYISIKRSDVKNDQLIRNGIIIKNLQYELVSDSKNDKFKRIQVKYVTDNNIELKLLSKQLILFEPKDKTVDLLIDKDNLSNYYIDFEII